MEKIGLYGFGYLGKGRAYLEKLQQHATETVDEQALNQYVQQQIERGEVVYYGYQANGSLAYGPDFSPAKAQAKAVATGYTDHSGDKLLACTRRGPSGSWGEVFFTDHIFLFNTMRAYRMGFLSFRSYEEADAFISAIHQNLLPGEKWQFAKGEQNPALVRPKTRYEILESYLQMTFSKLVLEYQDPQSPNYQKIIFSKDGKYCYFNTGLLTNFAEDLYLIGEVYGKKPNGLFICNDPRMADGQRSLVTRYGFAKEAVQNGPGVATFFTRIQDIIYDPSVPIDFTAAKLQHIIVDGIERGRFPRHYTQQYQNGQIALWDLSQKLKAGIENARLIATRNYKYVVPQYRAATRQRPGAIQFLMPIYLDRMFDKQPDFALVLSYHDGYYVPETILLLAWAYQNARILCKPDDSWLNPSEIVDDAPEGAPSDESTAAPVTHHPAPAVSTASAPPQSPATAGPSAVASVVSHPAAGDSALTEGALAFPHRVWLRQLTIGNNASLRGLFDGDKVGTISRKKAGDCDLEPLLGQQMLVDIVARNPLGGTYQATPVRDGSNAFTLRPEHHNCAVKQPAGTPAHTPQAQAAPHQGSHTTTGTAPATAAPDLPAAVPAAATSPLEQLVQNLPQGITVQDLFSQLVQGMQASMAPTSNPADTAPAAAPAPIPAPPPPTAGPTSSPSIGDIVVLRDIKKGNNGGIRGVFGDGSATATISRSLLTHPKAYYYEKQLLPVRLLGVNPLGGGFRAEPAEQP